MKRVLYISYDGMTDPLGQSQVIPYLKGLSELGHKIIIISAEKEERFHSGQKDLRKELAQNEIGWYPVAYLNTVPFLSQYATYKRLRRTSILLQEEHHFDIVHCRSYIPSLVGLELKRKYGVKFIFDMRGFWADERVEGEIWNLKNPLYRKAYHFFKTREKEFLEESNAIVSLTEMAKQEIFTWNKLKVEASKISVIPCCTDLNLFAEEMIDAKEQHQLRDRLKISVTDFVLGYSGSLGTWYLLDEMLKFFKCLLLMEPQAKFLFITPDTPNRIRRAAASAGIAKEKIMILSAQRKQMPSLQGLCQACVCFIKNSFSKKASSPAKLGEWMAMGIPVVCNTGIGDIDEVIGKSKAGIVLPSFTDEEFKAAAWQLLEGNFSKEGIRKTAALFFSLEKGVAAYDKIYNGL